MSALFEVHYHGIAGAGGAAIYIGKGQILGVGIEGAHYHGTYSEEAGRLSGHATLTSAGVPLVTGQAVRSGEKVSIAFSLPADTGGGTPVQITVGGKPVMASFTKVGDIP